MLSADDLFEQIDEAYLKVLNELEIADPQPGGVGVAPGAPETSDKPEVGNAKSSLECHPSAASSSRSSVAPDTLLTNPLGADPDKVQTPSTQAVQCLICDMWLNGPTQFEDHRIGKKHEKLAQITWHHEVGNAGYPSRGAPSG